MKSTPLICLLLTPFILPLPAREIGDIKEEGTAPGAAEVEVKYELHRRLESLEQGGRFSDMSRTKSTLRNDIITLDRLLKEKDGELSRMNTRLEKNYPVDLSKDYRFDLETRTLFEITTVGKDQASKEEKVVKFEDEQKQEVFVRLLTSKRLTQVTISSLKLLLREKRLELKGVNDRLLSEFGILSDKNYLYHAKSNVIFLIVPVVKGDSPKKRKSQGPK